MRIKTPTFPKMAASRVQRFERRAGKTCRGGEGEARRRKRSFDEEGGGGRGCEGGEGGEGDEGGGSIWKGDFAE